MMFRLTLAVVLVVGTLHSDANAQGRRLALVIGISDYVTTGWSLDRAVPDAEAVADALRKHAKFSVTPILDPTSRLLRLQVEEFAAKVRDGDVVVVYYAGHGIQHRGRNYLLPSDFPADLAQVDTQALSADDLLAQIAAKKPLMRLLILDACRNNPLPGAPTGLASLEPPQGSQIRVEFSAAAGKVARDGLYAKHLTAALTRSGLDVDAVFREVRQKVEAESNGAQSTFSSTTLTVNFFFVAPDNEIADAERGLALLERTAATMPQGDMGQVAALEALVRRRHSLAGTRLLQGVALRSGNFTGGDFKGASLAGSDLSAATLMDADLSNADLSYSTLRGVAGDKATLQGTRFVLADLDCSTLKPPCASFRHAIASQSVWFGAAAGGVDFSEANLTGAQLVYADLRGANFNGATLAGASFVGSDLRGASFKGAKFADTDFGLAKWSSAELPAGTAGACATELVLPTGYYGGVLKFSISELIPNPTIRGGIEYRDERTDEFLMHKFWTPTLPACGPVGTTGDRWQAVSPLAGRASHFRTDYGVGLDQKLLQRAGLRAQLRQRLQDLAMRLWPMPTGKFQLTPREGGAVGGTPDTFLTFSNDGQMQLTQQSKTIWRGRFDFYQTPNSIRLTDNGASQLCSEEGNSAVYRWIWTSATTFTLSRDTFGHEKCEARRKLFEISRLQLATR